MEFTELPFEYETRYGDQYKEWGIPMERAALLEERDRQLEDYLAGLTGGSPVPFLVAASDAPQAYRDAADYLCDGTADEVQINQAITDAGSTGAEVWLSPGDFDIADTIDLAGGYATLRGCGMLFAGTVLSVSLSGSAAVVDLGGGSAIRNLAIDGNQTDIATGIYVNATSHVESVFIYDLGDPSGSLEGLAIRVLGSPDVVVSNCYLWDIAGIGIQAGSYSRIIGNHVRGSGLSSIFADRERSGIVANSRCSVVGNTLQDCYLGIYEDGSQNAITGNVVEGSTAAGIESDRASQSTITANIVATHQGHGISVSSGDGILVAANVITYGTPTSGIDGVHLSASTDVLVTGNTVYAGSMATNMANGVNIADASCTTCKVVGNELSAGGGNYGTAPISDSGTGTILTWPAHATYGDNFT